MARPDDLCPGWPYFTVHFVDEGLSVPIVETWLYVGVTEDEDRRRLWLFKEPGDHSGAETPQPIQMVSTDRDLAQVFDARGLAAYMAAEAQLRVVESTEPPQFGISLQGRAVVEREIGQLLTATAEIIVVFTIRFPDEAVSVRRTDDGEAEVSLLVRPPTAIEAERAIGATFERLGIVGGVTHSFNGGRSRSIDYRLRAQPAVVADCCCALLEEVWYIRLSDSLDVTRIDRADVGRR